MTAHAELRAKAELHGEVLAAMQNHGISKRKLAIYTGVTRQAVVRAMKRGRIAPALRDRMMEAIEEIVKNRERKEDVT